MTVQNVHYTLICVFRGTTPTSNIMSPFFAVVLCCCVENSERKSLSFFCLLVHLCATQDQPYVMTVSASPKYIERML